MEIKSFRNLLFFCGFLQERRGSETTPARLREKSCGVDVFVKQIRSGTKDFELQIIQDVLLSRSNWM